MPSRRGNVSDSAKLQHSRLPSTYCHFRGGGRTELVQSSSAPALLDLHTRLLKPKGKRSLTQAQRNGLSAVSSWTKWPEVKDPYAEVVDDTEDNEDNEEDVARLTLAERVAASGRLTDGYKAECLTKLDAIRARRPDMGKFLPCLDKYGTHEHRFGVYHGEPGGFPALPEALRGEEDFLKTSMQAQSSAAASSSSGALHPKGTRPKVLISPAPLTKGEAVGAIIAPAPPGREDRLGPSSTWGGSSSSWVLERSPSPRAAPKANPLVAVTQHRVSWPDIFWLEAPGRTPGSQALAEPASSSGPPRQQQQQQPRAATSWESLPPSPASARRRFHGAVCGVGVGSDGNVPSPREVLAVRAASKAASSPEFARRRQAAVQAGAERHRSRQGAADAAQAVAFLGAVAAPGAVGPVMLNAGEAKRLLKLPGSASSPEFKTGSPGGLAASLPASGWKFRSLEKASLRGALSGVSMNSSSQPAL